MVDQKLAHWIFLFSILALIMLHHVFAGCPLPQPAYSLGLMLKPLWSVCEFPAVDGRISAKLTEKSTYESRNKWQQP